MRATELFELSAIELLAGYRGRAFSPLEVAQALLKRIDAVDPKINAFRQIAEEDWLSAARASESRWMRSQPSGALDGVPVSVKDLVETRGMATLRGSKTIDPRQAWDRDALAVANLRFQGAIIFGKTTTSEFGVKIVTDSPLTGTTRNPWDTRLSSGGSSGGSGAAVAAGMGPVALASDGGGSIRIPSAWCGVFGFKPSYKRIPAPAAGFNSLSVLGPIARTVADAALMMTVLAEAGQEADCFALPIEHRDYRIGLEDGIAGLRIAYSPDLGIAEVDSEIAAIADRAATAFEGLGAHVEAVAVPALEGYVESRIHSTQWIVNTSSLVAGIPAEQHSLLDPDVLRLARLGREVTREKYFDALNRRSALAQEMHRFFCRYDLLLTPTFHVGPPAAPGLPPALDEAPRMTSWCNQTMQPAASIPCGLTSRGVPVGLQVVGPRYADALVLRACKAYESARGRFPAPSIAPTD